MRVVVHTLCAPLMIALRIAGADDGCPALQATQVLPTLFPSTRVAMGDINRDGHSEIITVDNTSRSITIQPSDGTGGFGPALVFNATHQMGGVVAGDLNGDGSADLVVLHGGTSTSMSVYRGLPNGTIAYVSALTVGALTQNAVLRDFDADGDLDIVSAAETASTLSFFRNLGNLTFAAPVITACPGSSRTVDAGDIDGDGDIDVVVGNTNNSTGLNVLRNTGNGTWGPMETYSGLPNLDATLADMDVDGDLDVLAHNGGYDKISLRKNNGAGVFGPEEFTDFTGEVLYVNIADVNRDTLPDVITVPYISSPSTQNRSVGVWINKGNGVLDYAFSHLFGGVNPVDAMLADANGDGLADLATVGSLSETVTIAYGAPEGMFVAPQAVALPTEPVSMACGDLNGDSYPDAVISTGSGVLVFLNQGNAEYAQAATLISGTACGPIGLEDLDHDGDLDIGVLKPSTDHVILLRNDGTAQFGSQLTILTANDVETLSFADVNMDGRPDIVTMSLIPSKLAIIKMQPAAWGTEPKVELDTTPHSSWVGGGDVDGDSDTDIIVSSFNSDNVCIHVNSGAGVFGPPTGCFSIPTGDPTQMVLGDLNADGRCDVIVRTSTKSFYVLAGTSEPGFALWSICPIYAGLFQLAAGDMDGDGWEDIVTLDTISSAVTVTRQVAPGVYHPGAMYAMNAVTKKLCMADADQDGRADIVIAVGTIPRILVVTSPCPDVCTADFDGNGMVDGADLGTLLGYWGSTPLREPEIDMNSDGIVDGSDLGTLLGKWGPCP